MSYPETPGWKGDPNGPGADAAALIAPTLNRRLNQVLGGLGSTPSTSEQVAERIGLHWYVVRPRLSDLKARGLVIETGQRGRSALGGHSTIWRPTTEEERHQFNARKALAAEKGPDHE